MNIGRAITPRIARKVEVIGAAWKEGQPRPGTEVSPDELRKAGLLTSLQKNLGLEVIDLGNITLPKDVDFSHKKLHELDIYNKVGHLNGKLSAAIAKSSPDTLTMVLGGDHSLGCGSIHGSLLKHGDDLRVIWIDAHADINTPQTSITKNYHGMPVAHVSGLFDPVPYTGFDWLTKRLNPRHLVYIGIRDLDDAEKKFVCDHKIKSFSPFDIDRVGGIQKAMAEAFHYLGLDKKDKKLHVSFDVDSADESVIGGTGTPSRYGLSAREIILAMRRIHASGSMVHLDVAEVNTSIASDKPYVRYHGDNHDIQTTSLTVYNTCEFVHYALGKTHWEA